MKSKLVSLMLLALLLLSSATVFRAVSLPPDSMWIEPTALDGAVLGGVGEKFNVTIWLNVETPTNSWQYYLVYNKNHLDATGAWYSGDGKSEWSGTDAVDTVEPSFGDHDGTHGYVLHGEVLKQGKTRTGQGSLGIVEFEIINAPGKYETLESILSLAEVGIFYSYALDADLEEIPLTFGAATYTYAWTMPPSPHLAVDPTLVEYGPYPPPAVGEEFDIDVYIMGLSGEWGLHNASFTLTYDAALLEVLSVTVAPEWTTSSIDTSTPGVVGVFVGDFATPPPYGNVLLVTVRFNVTYQGSYPDVDESPLTLGDIVLWNTVEQIPADPSVNGLVRINGLLTLELPYLEVSSVTMGPEPARGELFNVTVSIKNLEFAWYFVGLDFRLSYDPDLITPVAAYEGPFMPYWSSQQPDSLGTFWVSYFESDGSYGPHVLVGNMIYPNGTGRWNPPFPEGNGTVAIITFRVEYQSFGEPDLNCTLEIIEQTWVGLDSPVDQNIVDIPYDDPVNGVYTITTHWPGRAIDVYTQYPAPFGGQGFNQPSDMFWPQKEVILYANVTYNYWPVQQKDVAFEIRDPSGELWAVLVARTDENGVATTSFRIPWPCENPEDLFGVWTVTATVDVACEVVNDTLQFHFDYLVEIFKVTTDKFEYNHCEDVEITIEYGSHAQQTYPLLLYVVIKDELGVPIGIAFVETTIGGAQFCSYKNGTAVVRIHIDKFAFAGIATIHVTAYNKLPSQGGFAYCPTYGDGWPIGAEIPTIAIQPY